MGCRSLKAKPSRPGPRARVHGRPPRSPRPIRARRARRERRRGQVRVECERWRKSRRRCRSLGSLLLRSPALSGRRAQLEDPGPGPGVGRAMLITRETAAIGSGQQCQAPSPARSGPVGAGPGRPGLRLGAGTYIGKPTQCQRLAYNRISGRQLTTATTSRLQWTRPGSCSGRIG